MLAGELYDPLDPELCAARDRARELCRALNATGEAEPEERRRIVAPPVGSWSRIAAHFTRRAPVAAVAPGPIRQASRTSWRSMMSSRPSMSTSIPWAAERARISSTLGGPCAGTCAATAW